MSYSIDNNDFDYGSSDDWYLQRRREIQEDDEYVQPKLQVSQPGDPDEQAADKIAHNVVNGGNANIGNSFTTGNIVQPKSGGGASTLDNMFRSRLNSGIGGGQPLDESTRSEMETKMGADFSKVKIHTGHESNIMNDQINSRAFTFGQNVYFNEGNYNTSTKEGKELLAHELVHTRQQSNMIQPRIQRAVKFEIQTANMMWVMSGGAFKRVERKFGEFGATERGDLPAYITTGKHGSPAMKKGQEYYEEVKGPLTMKKAKPNYDVMIDATSDVPAGQSSQFVRTVLVNDMSVLTSGKKPKSSALTVLSELDKASDPGKFPTGSFVPGIYEIVYYDASKYQTHDKDGKPLKTGPAPLLVHQEGKDGVFVSGIVRYMKPSTVVQDNINVLVPAQFVREYKFKESVTEAGILNKPVGKIDAGGAGELALTKQTDNAELFSDPTLYNPNTYENIYFNADGVTRLDVHLDEDGLFKDKHWPYMKIGRKDIPGHESGNRAQYSKNWKVTEDAAGKFSYYDPLAGREMMVAIEEVSEVNYGDETQNPGKAISYVADTYEHFYYMASDFSGAVPDQTKELNVHLDDNRLKAGHVAFARKMKAAGNFVTIGKKSVDVGKEQSAMELQSEAHGFIEFETPKWFTNWDDLKLRVEDAVEMTKTLNASTPFVLTSTQKTALQALKDSDSHTKGRPVGTIREWPASMLKPEVSKKLLPLSGDKLYVEIVNDRWPAFFQTSESVALSKVGNLLQEPWVDWDASAAQVLAAADNIFRNVKAASKFSGYDDSVFANLKGFLQTVLSYILWGQTNESKGHKDTFPMMARTDFASMYAEILSPEEKELFVAMLGNPSIATDNPMFSAEFETAINAHRVTNSLSATTLNRTLRFYSGGHSGGDAANPYIYSWLKTIPSGKDLLAGSQTNVADAIGGRKVNTTPGDKMYKQAQFELRWGFNVDADEWVKHAKLRFEQAMVRSADLPDDPTSQSVNETSRTGIKLK